MPLLLAFLLGVIAGLRSMTAAAAASWAANLRWPELQAPPVAFMGTTAAAYIFTVLAVVELIFDKLPFTPSRLTPPPLTARIAMGGLCGAALCAAAGDSVVAGTMLGALGGLTGAFLGYHARGWLVKRLHVRDVVVAALEDVVAVAGAVFLVTRI